MLLSWMPEISIRCLKASLLHLNDVSLGHMAIKSSRLIQTVARRFSREITVKLMWKKGDLEREQREDDSDASMVNRGNRVLTAVPNCSKI